MDESETLLACPFCGSAAEYGESEDGGNFIQCTGGTCKASSKLIYPEKTDPYPLLREAWNERAGARVGEHRAIQNVAASECGMCPADPRRHRPGCSLDRNSPESLQQRLHNAKEMLTSALNLIGAMQPVVSAVERFFDRCDDDITELSIALAKYRDYIKSATGQIHRGEHQTSNIKHAVQPQARHPADHRGSPGKADQTGETPQATANAGS